MGSSITLEYLSEVVGRAGVGFAIFGHDDPAQRVYCDILLTVERYITVLASE